MDPQTTTPPTGSGNNPPPASSSSSSSSSASIPPPPPPPLTRHPPPPVIAHSKLRYHRQMSLARSLSLPSSSSSAYSGGKGKGMKGSGKSLASSSNPDKAPTKKISSTIGSILSSIDSHMSSLGDYVATGGFSSNDGDVAYILEWSDHLRQILASVDSISSRLEELEEGKGVSKGGPPWKQRGPCQCREDIYAEIVSLMEAECCCQICEEIFVDANVTACGHTFCELCVKKWYSSSAKKDCPMCRRPLKLGEVKRNVEVDSFVTRMHLRLSPKIRGMREKLVESRRKKVERFNATLLPEVSPNAVLHLISQHRSNNSNNQRISLGKDIEDKNFRKIRSQIRQELSQEEQEEGSSRVDVGVQTDDPLDIINNGVNGGYIATNVEELLALLEPQFGLTPIIEQQPVPSTSTSAAPKKVPSTGKRVYEDMDDDDVQILPTPTPPKKDFDIIDISSDEDPDVFTTTELNNVEELLSKNRIFSATHHRVPYYIPAPIPTLSLGLVGSGSSSSSSPQQEEETSQNDEPSPTPTIQIAISVYPPASSSSCPRGQTASSTKPQVSSSSSSSSSTTTTSQATSTSTNSNNNSPLRLGLKRDASGHYRIQPNSNKSPSDFREQ